jgi:hypothetical protein
VIERLDELQDEECITSYTVTVWGEAIAPESTIARTEAGQAILETVDEFTRWAAQHDLSFLGAFEEQKITSMIDDEQWTVIPFPTMCLAVREDGGIRCVAPCSAETLTHSIHDCLDELVIGETESDVHDWPTVRSTDDQ